MMLLMFLLLLLLLYRQDSPIQATTRLEPLVATRVPSQGSRVAFDNVVYRGRRQALAAASARPYR